MDRQTEQEIKRIKEAIAESHRFVNRAYDHLSWLKNSTGYSSKTRAAMRRAILDLRAALLEAGRSRWDE